MQIRTITCHDVYNYGASLQAYALQCYLEHLGHDVQIIDYYPDYMDVNYRVRWGLYEIPTVSCLYRFRCIPGVKTLYRIKMSLKKLIFIIEKGGRKSAFDCFKSQFLKLTPVRYRNINDLRSGQLKADVFIAGSDQIWNPLFTNGRDPSFFLQFGKGKKISFAASFGVSSLTPEDADNMKKWLSAFDKISVREKTGLELLKSLDVHDAIQVLDPVFLLQKSDWQKIASSKYGSEKFVLVYNLGLLSQDIKKCALYLSRAHNLKIVAIEERGNVAYADKRIKDAGPCEFIELFLKASYVVTNSFHATSYSIIFNIPFFSFIKDATSSRVSGILKLCGLEKRLNASDFNAGIAWDDINSKVSLLRKVGIDYLGSF